MLRKACHHPTFALSAPIACEHISLLVIIFLILILLFQARIRDPNPDTRATVVSAIRYTFADTSRSFDEVFSPLLVDFLSLMVDENLVSAPQHLLVTKSLIGCY